MDGSTSIHQACFYGHSEIVSQLIAAGASLGTQDSSKSTPLHLAAMQVRSACFRSACFLYMFCVYSPAQVTSSAGACRGTGTAIRRRCTNSAGAARQAKPDSAALGGRVWLNSLSWRPCSETCSLTPPLQVPHPECVGFLLGKGAAIEPKDRAGFTPLVLAVQLGCEESIRLLLARGANVQVRTGDGRTLQEIASEANTYQGKCLLTCSQPHQLLTRTLAVLLKAIKPSSSARLPGPTSAGGAAPGALDKAALDPIVKKFNQRYG
jgi:hypothetical protein